ncbi:transcription factor HHO5 [Ricinus communis]|uniref:DNA binding protein, putative n=1 Tax=Ricinus communis TaxID=3988 RepID=B9S8K9_RICCO|nr:transcription factor HHO5 [Ricinus communis]EEF40012.1 DNA binding protein, putative [Ricinus communis]|eukprot:XP_002522328.1 transcription factor HHO5 [Ricinus communis]
MELSLDLSLVYVPKTISEYLKEVSKVKDSSLKLSKLDDYVQRLEDEMRKIDAFKRELPLCMLLLNDAIVRLKEEAMQCKELEEVVSVKGNSCRNEERELENDMIDKKNWMSSVQLWNNNNHTNNNNFDSENQESKSETKQRSEEDDDRSTCENPTQLCNHRSKGGGFMPFKSTSGFEKKEEKEVVSQVTGLSLMTPVSELGSRNLMSKTNGTDQFKIQNKPQQQQQQPYKKQRRCWSPELHRRFIDALHQLGGSQVATPKQIRELMQVDGLTNDEVKSHLQKYRLHIRKLPASSAAQANALWMAQNGHKDDSSKQSNSKSSSPQGPLHGCGSAKGMSSTGGDSMEVEDDDRSVSNSWNGRQHKQAGEVDV